MAERDPILSDEILAAEQEAIAATGGLLAVSPELLAAMQPPPPVTGTPARTLAQKLEEWLDARFEYVCTPERTKDQSLDFTYRDGYGSGWEQGWNDATREVLACPAINAQPAPVAADGAGHDLPEYIVGNLYGVPIFARARGGDTDVLRAAFDAMKIAAARLAAAEAARAAAVTECRYLRAAISEALAMVDEAYQATGYIKIAETSEQRQRLEALAAPAGGQAKENANAE